MTNNEVRENAIKGAEVIKDKAEEIMFFMKYISLLETTVSGRQHNGYLADVEDALETIKNTVGYLLEDLDETIEKAEGRA